MGSGRCGVGRVHTTIMRKPVVIEFVTLGARL